MKKVTVEDVIFLSGLGAVMLTLLFTCVYQVLKRRRSTPRRHQQGCEVVRGTAVEVHRSQDMTYDTLLKEKEKDVVQIPNERSVFQGQYEAPPAYQDVFPSKFARPKSCKIAVLDL